MKLKKIDLIYLSVGFCKNRPFKKIENGHSVFHCDIRVAQLLKSIPFNRKETVFKDESESTLLDERNIRDIQ
jgi:hypothetical protein